jgi:hypothetical protein
MNNNDPDSSNNLDVEHKMDPRLDPNNFNDEESGQSIESYELYEKHMQETGTIQDP